MSDRTREEHKADPLTQFGMNTSDLESLPGLMLGARRCDKCMIKKYRQLGGV